MKSPYWQHNEPLKCPKSHAMIWLGLSFWVCPECHTVYVQVDAKRGGGAAA